MTKLQHWRSTATVMLPLILLVASLGLMDLLLEMPARSIRLQLQFCVLSARLGVPAPWLARLWCPEIAAAK